MNGDFDSQTRKLGETVSEAMSQIDKQMNSPALKASMQAAANAERSLGRMVDRIEEGNRAVAHEAQRRARQNESAAIATVETAEAIKAMNAALTEESSKRDRSDKRNLIIGIASVLLMIATLLATLLK